jgi:hypothetical protein
MPSFELFSKRQKRIRGEVPDVLVYDVLPRPLRVQIFNVFIEQIGPQDECETEYGPQEVRNLYEFIVAKLRDEHGLHSLTSTNYQSAFRELKAFIETGTDVERVLDAVELACRTIDKITRSFDYRRRPESSESGDAALKKINRRFREHGVGFQFESGEIIRIDSTLLHSETVKPALRLLCTAGFFGAEEEFLSAYSHFRHDRPKEALNDALKALESTLKTICEQSGWSYRPTDTARPLLDACFQNGLIPPFWLNQMSALRATLEGGVPVARNKLGGHGQGTAPTQVPAHLVAYILHMTAAAIVFLVQAHQERPSST